MRASPLHYEIYDRRTGNIETTAKTLKGALSAVDRRDNAFGAVRYCHRAVWTMITVGAAMASLDARQITSDFEGRQLFDCRTGENIAVITDGMVSKEIVEAYGA